MKKLWVLSLVVFVSGVAVVPSSVGHAAVVDPIPLCVGTKPGPPGSPSINFTLTANTAGTAYQLTGQATFSQAIAPPNGLVIYSVIGAAIANPDGFWLSLVGTGYDLAKTVFIGTFGLQLSADPAKNTLTYAKQSLDATAPQVVNLTGAVEVKNCPPLP
jgi:hypothetical protein